MRKDYVNANGFFFAPHTGNSANEQSKTRINIHKAIRSLFPFFMSCAQIAPTTLFRNFPKQEKSPKTLVFGALLVRDTSRLRARSRFGSEAPQGLHSPPNRSVPLPGMNRTLPRRFSCWSGTTKEKTPIKGAFSLEAPPGIEPGIRVLQTRALPLGHGAAAGCWDPDKKWSGKRGSNPPPQPWQGCALPNELFPQIGASEWT